MKIRAAAFFAAITGIVAVGALLASAASAGTVGNYIDVTIAGTGSGTVVADKTGISCPGTCHANYPMGDTVVLTATPASGSVFAGFSGSCTSTTATTCTVSGNTLHAITATFSLDTDGDGVPDASDQCPSLPGPADNNGCPKYTPPDPVPGPDACAKARLKLANAKEKLAKLKDQDASDAKIDSAKSKVKKARKARKKACAAA